MPPFFFVHIESDFRKRTERVRIKILFQLKLWVEGKASTFLEPKVIKDLRNRAQTLGDGPDINEREIKSWKGFNFWLSSWFRCSNEY